MEGQDVTADIEHVDTADPTQSWERIQAVLRVLGAFKERRMPGKSRADYIDALASDLCDYYGYSRELTDLFLRIFSPAECIEFMEASDKPRPVVVRTNTLKARRKELAQVLIKRGVHLETLAPWSKVALKINESDVPIGATPEYLAGHYMLQSAASLCPVMALDPQPNERILDLASAPGGKASYVAQLMKNTGAVVSNDMKKERHKASVANLHRLGVSNAIICCHDGKAFPGVMGGFDRVLLDAPCTGLGVISRDQSIKGQRTLADIHKLAHLQKELVLAAIDSCDHKKAGVIVYSTCSVSVEEDEEVVQYALKKRHVRLVDTGLDHGKPAFVRYQQRRFHPTLHLARRFYPHVHNMDGFFVAKFVKFAAGPRVDTDDDDGDAPDDDSEKDEPSKKRKAAAVTGGKKPTSRKIHMASKRSGGKNKGRS
ncbi:NOL1/NOP2/sun family-domain-containing protein [Pelagophyceae sp. CCMP2097]|nr:NOL1/NOP2/sun family-domain-containing protein [Pelagophyceae sp. CCMP2097]|mmetsp:Transcript_9126/g.30172  ORF Transcript_9126/g.30172 Transcript_9126/m.30172 type:complete len:428 (+) Transcript_9126:31-1314(+)